MRGWEYALTHKQEAVDLILERYSKGKSREALLFEANATESLIQPNLVKLGSQSVERWEKIADVYRSLGMLADDGRVPVAAQTRALRAIDPRLDLRSYRGAANAAAVQARCRRGHHLLYPEFIARSGQGSQLAACFTMYMRLYWPKPEALEGRWTAPPLKRVA